MKKWMGLLATLLFCGCQYDVPLTEDAVIPVDPALTGIWQEIPDEGNAEDPDDRMVILPFSKTEDVVVMSPGKDALYFRAYPVRIEDLDLVQLEWLSGDKEKDESYLVSRYSLKDGILTVEVLNDDVVSPEIKDSALLRKALLENRSNPELFGEPGRYRKLDD